MPIEWSTDLKQALRPIPNYEDLIKRLEEGYRYPSIRRLYAMTLSQAAEFTLALLGGDPRRRYDAWAAQLAGLFRRLEKTASDTCALVLAVNSRAKFEAYITENNITALEMIDLLKYWLYRVLPSKYYLREIAEEADEDQAYVETLRGLGVRFNLDLLEKGQHAAGRQALAAEAGVPLEWIEDLVHRADVSRMAYTRGASVRNFFHAGYNSLEKLAQANPAELTAAMEAYGRSVGMNFKHGMEFDSAVAVARVTPKLVE